MKALDRIYREVDGEASRRDHAEMPARRALLTGVLSSAFFLAVGLVILLLKREPRPNEPPKFGEMLAGLLRLRGTALVYLGLLVLGLTPILRVTVLIGVYFRRREHVMLAISIIVLLLLGIGILIGSG